MALSGYTYFHQMYLKVICFLSVFAVCFQSLSAQLCTDPLNVIYGLGQNGKIQPIHVSDGSVDASITSSGAPGYPGPTTSANAIGLDIQTETFYYFQDNSTSTQQFVSFNSVTNQYTTLANSPISGGVVKGGVTADGTGYYCIDGDGDLCYYNIPNNTWAVISSNLTDQANNNLADTLSSLGSGDIAIDGIGNLWIIVSSPTLWGLYELKAPLPVTPAPTVQLTEIISPVQPTPSGSHFAGIAYNATGQIYLSTANDLYLLQNNLSITHLATFSVPGTGDDLTSCNYPFDVLAVHWNNFNAFLESENKVLLTWSVNQQADDKGYNIEHSTDGKTWQVIAYESNNQINGTVTYSFLHINTNAGENYYRIQLTGADGKMSYSEIKMVTITTTGSKLSVWPVPAANVLHVQIRGNNNNQGNRIMIFNSSGKLFFSRLLHAGINAVDISSFNSGDYVVKVVSAKGEVFSQKMEKL